MKLRKNKAYLMSRALLYVGLCAFIAVMWYTDTADFRGLNDFYKAMFADLVYGTARRPWVMRALLPLIIRGTTMLVPTPVMQFLTGDVVNVFPWVGDGIAVLEWELAYLPEFMIGGIYVFLCILGFTLGLRRLTKLCFDTEDWVLDLIPLLSLFILPAFFRRGTHMLYDMPVLLLFTWGLVWIREGRVKLYYVLYVLALLNKETAVLLAIAFAFWNRRTMPWRRLVPHLAAQVVLALAMRRLLTWWFSGNVGTNAEDHFVTNIRLYLKPYGFSTMLSLALPIMAIGYRYRTRPKFLRECLWIGLPLLGSYMLMGVWAEIRVFYEIYAVLFLLGMPAVAAVMGWRMEPIPDDVAASA